MRSELPIDDDLIQRLPLPLAQLYRRAHNAKTARDRHDAAYYLWEAALKLLGSVAVVSFLHTGRTPDAHLADVLQNLARPAVGHWWALVRALTVELADSDADFARLKDLLLGRARDDLPRVAGLDAALVAVLDGKAGGRSTVRLTELFDRLVRYRNQEIGHGAVGQRASSHYEEMGRALLAGVPQLLERLDVLAGRRLVYLADVRRLSSGTWLVERYELAGEAARRLESLERTHDEAAALLPQQVYLAGAALLPLHPLVAYDLEANEFLFLNARRGKQRVEYLCYTSGRPIDRVEPASQNALLAQLLNMPVDDARREEWQARSQAEEPASAEHQLTEARRTLGEFELLSELGRGGMGVVYRAWQPSLGRQVALKSLLKIGDAKAEKRFSREIAALGHVEHPHLVRVFTSGSEGESYFYAMELVEGTTLATVCDRLSASGSSAGEVDLATWRQAVGTACEEARRGEKPLGDTVPDAPASPAEKESDAATTQTAARTGMSYVRHVVELILQTAEAAHALHEKGIVHRDIKPGNIMVGAVGASATLMDLGLAQVADETEGRLTKTRQFVGTLRYASPEQVLAVARLDRRSDVYSLGATLWELLALRPLFGATDEMPTPELMQKIQIEEPGRVRRHNPEVPRDLAAVVDKCLQKDPKRRYATAAELAGELSAFLSGKPVKARPVTGPERLWKWARRRPAQAIALVMTVLTLVSLAVGGTLFAWEAEQARREANAHAQNQERLRKEADDKRDEADRHRREAEKQKSIAEREKDRADKRANDLKVALGRAEKAEKESRDEAEQVKKERDRTIAVLANSLVRRADSEWEAGHVNHARELLDDVPNAMRHWAWKYLHRKFEGGYCTLYGHTAAVTGVAFSPDGKWLASGSEDQTVIVWDAVTGQEIRKLRHGKRVTSVVFSPDGQKLATSSGWFEVGKVRIWDAVTWNEIGTRFEGHTSGVNRVAFSPDGKWLASASQDNTVIMWDALTGRNVQTLRHDAGVTSVAFSPDGKWLASGTSVKTLKLWNVSTGQPVWTIKPVEYGVVSVAFSPDGKKLATPGSDGVKIWDVETGNMASTLFNYYMDDLVFSPDGKQLAGAEGYMPGGIKVWDMMSGKEVATLRGHTRGVKSVRFSPDGKRMASGSEDCTVKLWDLATDQSAYTLAGHTTKINSIAFSRDGKLLASGSGWPREKKKLGEVKVWDVIRGKEIFGFQRGIGPVDSVTFSPDGKRLACGSVGRRIQIWDLATGKEYQSLQGNTYWATSVAFSPDGKLLAAGFPTFYLTPGVVRMWEVATGKNIYTLETGDLKCYHNSVVFGPDGKWLASTNPGKDAVVWDVVTGRKLFTIEGHTKQISSVAYSPASKRLATASWDRTAKIWDLATGREVHTLKGHQGTVTSAAFYSDGKWLASTSEDRTVKVWDLATGQEVLNLMLTSDGNSVAFSADGKRLACADGSENVKVWELIPPHEVLTLKGHDLDVASVAFSPDGKRLVSADKRATGGEVKVWDTSTGQIICTLDSCWENLAFGPDGKTLWSRRRELEWNGSQWVVRGVVEEPRDLKTGKKLPNPGQRPVFFAWWNAKEWQESKARSSSVQRLALRDGHNIMLVNVSQPGADELAFRKAKARFDPFWHKKQAEGAESNSQWFAAVFHRSLLAENLPWDLQNWTRLQDDSRKLGDYRRARVVCERILQRDPTLAPIYLQRSLLRLHAKDARDGWADLLRNVYLSLSEHPDWIKFGDSSAELGKKAANKKDWPRAVGYYTLASVWHAHDPIHLHYLAWVSLAGGDEEGYRSICRHLYDRFGNQDSAKGANIIAWTATLLPDSGINPQTLVALAARAVKTDSKNAAFRETYGAALFRAGNYTEAVKQLKEAVEFHGGEGNIWQRVFLAMAYHRLHDEVEARKWLEVKDKTVDDFSGWEDWLIYERLRQQEAAELFRDAAFFFSQGDAYYAKKDYDRALQAYTEAIRIEPSKNQRESGYRTSWAFKFRGNCYFAKKDYDRAIQDYTEAIRRDPKYKNAFCSRGDAYDAKKDYDLAIQDYNEAIRLDPKYDTAFNNRGNCYSAKKEYDRAIQDYTQAIQLDAKMAFYFQNRGNALYAKKDYERAIQNYTEAIRLDPKSVKAFFCRGFAYDAMKEFDRAIQDYTEVIKLDPKADEAFNNRGVCYYDKKDYDRAVQDYTEAIRLDPNDALHFKNRGNAFDAKKDYDRAIQDYHQAIRLNSKYNDVFENRGNHYYHKKDYDRAIRYYTEAIRLDPKNISSFRRRGIAYEYKKDYDRAIEDYTQAIRLDAKDSAAFLYRGNAYYFKKMYKRSTEDYTEAIRLDPEDVNAIGSRACARSKLKQYADADHDFKEAFRLNSELDWLHRDYALFLATCPEASRRDGKKALKLATKALELAGQDADWEYHAALAAAYAEVGQFDQALAQQSKAMQDKSLDRDDRAKMEQRLKLYQEKKPYRDLE